MDKDYLNILIVGHTTFGVRKLKIKKETLKTLLYLLAFLQIAFMFCLCDYIQVRKKNFHLNRLYHESLVQKAHIQLFTARIEELEKRMNKLKNYDQKIRSIANLQRGEGQTPFIGMGGTPSPGIPSELKGEPSPHSP